MPSSPTSITANKNNSSNFVFKEERIRIAVNRQGSSQQESDGPGDFWSHPIGRRGLLGAFLWLCSPVALGSRCAGDSGTKPAGRIRRSRGLWGLKNTQGLYPSVRALCVLHGAGFRSHSRSGSLNSSRRGKQPVIDCSCALVGREGGV